MASLLTRTASSDSRALLLYDYVLNRKNILTSNHVPRELRIAGYGGGA